MHGVNSQVNALIRLLEDPDSRVFKQVSQQLIQLGEQAFPLLRKTLQAERRRVVLDDYHTDRIWAVARSIRYNKVKNDLKNWRSSSTRDLLRGVCIIAQLESPDVDEQPIEAALEAIKQKVWLEINESQTAFETVKVFNRILFDIVGFRSNRTHEHLPIHKVIADKRGNALLLCVVYSVIAQRLHIPIYGIALPHHFVLGFVDERQTKRGLGMRDSGSVLFYINPLSRGRIFGQSELKTYLTRQNLPLERHYFEPCSNTAILRRMLDSMTDPCLEGREVEQPNCVEELRFILES